MSDNNEKELKYISPFKYQLLQSFPFIADDFDQLTAYGLFCKLADKMNEVVENNNNLNDDMLLYIQKFNTLKAYVDNYFANLDVQDEINQKLDEMATDGTLTNLISGYIDPLIESIDNKVDAVASGAPSGVYPTAQSLASADPAHDKIYLVTSDGNWYYYNTVTSSWTSGGIYQTTGIALNSIQKKYLNKDIFNKDIIYFHNINTNGTSSNRYGKTFYFSVESNIQHTIKFKAKAKNSPTAETVPNGYVAILQLIVGDSLSNDNLQPHVLDSQNYNLTKTGENNIEFEKTFTPTKQYKYFNITLNTNLFGNNGNLDFTDIEFYIDNQLIDFDSVVGSVNSAFTLDFYYLITNIKQVASVDYVDEKITNQAKYNEINVTTAQELKNAIDSIATSASNNKATYNNRYRIILASGTYELYNVLDLSNIQDQQLFKRGLEIPDYVDLKGIGNVTIQCTLPTTETAEHIQAISTLNTYGENHFENLHIIANNCRYCVHDDDGGPYKNRKIEFKNCTFENTSTSGNFGQCYGAGYTGGRIGKFKNCSFVSNHSTDFYVHTSSDYYMTDICEVEIDNCAFNGTNTNSINLHDPYGAINQMIISINDSKISGRIHTYGTNPFVLYGGGNNNVNINNENNSINNIA